MVDFKKKLGKTQIDKKTDPLEIYNSLDRSSVTGPLRPAQSRILSDWYSERQDDKDLIIKLHTGEGKTLIGLLILLSKIKKYSLTIKNIRILTEFTAIVLFCPDPCNRAIISDRLPSRRNATS